MGTEGAAFQSIKRRHRNMLAANRPSERGCPGLSNRLPGDLKHFSMTLLRAALPRRPRFTVDRLAQLSGFLKRF